MNYPIADIGQILAAVVAVSLALAGALGPSIMLITEALKQALTLPNRVGGLVAMAVSVGLCILLALLTATVAVEAAGWQDYMSLGIVGILAGILVGASAIRSHRTAQTIPGPVPTPEPSASAGLMIPASWQPDGSSDDVDLEALEISTTRDRNLDA